jgi:hypothetical protein
MARAAGHGVIWLSALVALASTAAACSAPTARHAGPTTTATSSTITAPTSTTSAGPPGTASGQPAFPAVIVQAMATFDPLPAGAEAPIRLPAEHGDISAQTGGIGGQDNVTLVVAPQPYPVNSPQLSASNSRELASFATTPTSSPASARAALSRDEEQSIDACQGPTSPLTLSGGVGATTCPTVEGEAVGWRAGAWTVQVVTLGGSSPSTDEADDLAAELVPGSLPASDVGGMVSVVVPANPSVGRSPTADIEWAVGADLYQVRTDDDPDGALAVAGAMRPYPG